ncbi:hypothetical protein CYMTET_17081 [Cymbomonas tetramitiformis]|uniref:Uncharacterized protein n=1 Tax=Cymbomonas tetramitiformis TaxID=36881 RepID=A0AAE0GB84_9CHLO|nr:hypothetical protein CYMTET_17081 [Cymbomonas tetramitiformis]
MPSYSPYPGGPPNFPQLPCGRASLPYLLPPLDLSLSASDAAHRQQERLEALPSLGTGAVDARAGQGSYLDTYPAVAEQNVLGPTRFTLEYETSHGLFHPHPS